MSRAVNTSAASWTSRPTSPEVVRVLANAAAVGEIAIRKAATSSGGRALSSVVREYPLWSIFIASSIGFLLRGSRRPRRTAAPPPAVNKPAPLAKRRA